MLSIDQNKAIQGRLAPYYTGEVDGVFGRHTYAAMYCAAAGRDFGDGAVRRGNQAAIEFPKANINTPLRLVHFLAQCAHETEEFRYSEELWGPTPAQRGYEGRADLGNTQPGDGQRFKGRGDLEITGRWNYESFGNALGLDLLDHPELAAEPEGAVRIAVLFWTRKNLNAKADADDARCITRAINGGLNGMDERLARLCNLKRIFGL